MKSGPGFRRFYRAAVVAVLFVLVLPVALQGQQTGGAKYVFFMIGDGMGPAQRAAAELYLSGPQEKGKPIRLQKLTMNSLPVFGFARTNAVDAIVTDSGASATAMATGHKVPIATISLDANGNKLTTLAEIARERGWKVGIVSSAPIDDATPAAFYAHQTTRGSHYDISMELAGSGFDYFAGGAAMGARPIELEGRPSAVEAAKKNGYAIATNRDQLMALKPGAGKVWSYWALPDSNHTTYYEMDRPADQPSLVDFTRKGIELLDNPKGFFMMVEGGETDGACHAHDLPAAIGETLIFDQAVAAALEFQKKHPAETLILVTNDHETGGMALGGSGGGSLLFLHTKVAGQKKSQEVFDKKVIEFRAKKTTFEEALPAIKEFFGFEELAPASAKLLADAYAESMKDPASRRKDEAYLTLYARLEPLSAACSNLLGRQAGISWNSYNHTYMPAPVSAVGAGSELFAGWYENSDLFRKVLSAMAPK